MILVAQPHCDYCNARFSSAERKKCKGGGIGQINTVAAEADCSSALDWISADSRPGTIGIFEKPARLEKNCDHWREFLALMARNRDDSTCVEALRMSSDQLWKILLLNRESVAIEGLPCE